MAKKNGAPKTPHRKIKTTLKNWVDHRPNNAEPSATDARKRNKVYIASDYGENQRGNVRHLAPIWKTKNAPPHQQKRGLIDTGRNPGANCIFQIFPITRIKTKTQKVKFSWTIYITFIQNI